MAHRVAKVGVVVEHVLNVRMLNGVKWDGSLYLTRAAGDGTFVTCRGQRDWRLALEKHVYHVLTRGNNRQDVFKDEEDFRTYLDTLLRYKEKYHFRLYHYVMMTNHVHLIIEPSEGGGSLSEIMKGINLAYALHYKRKYDHTGHFWQDRYKSIVVSKDEYLLACDSYVELNPVRAKIAEDPKDYAWSSHRAHGYGKRNALVDCCF